MLIIKGLYSKSIVDWRSVESISFDESESPDSMLRVFTKSGSSISVLNPKLESGEALDFDNVVAAWVGDYTCWMVTENQSSKAPINQPF